MGLSVSLLAQKSGISEKKLTNAESQNHILTLKQVKNIAQLLMVSDVQLVIDNIYDKQLPQYIDHRNQSTLNNDEQHYQLNKLIHQLHNDRENLLEIYELTEEQHITFSLALTGKDEQEDAQRIRNYLQVEAAHLTIEHGDDYYRAWRTLLAQKDILVIEKSGLKIGSEGLALYYPHLPVIGILTSGQARSRRLFTMLHELVHLGLQQSCVDGDILSSEQQIETYCNRVAGHVLVPEHVVAKIYNSSQSLPDNIANIRKKTHASFQAIGIQLHILGMISNSELLDYVASLSKTAKADEEQRFGIGKKDIVYNQYGRFYLQQIIGAAWQGAVSISAAMNMLGLKKAKDFHTLQEKVFK